MISLLVARCADAGPEGASARERLEAALGPEFARKLVLALSDDARRPARNAAA